MSLHLQLEQVRESSAEAEALAVELGQRQAKWSAASSQLAASHLLAHPLSQVKEGKILGAGYDVSSLFTPGSGDFTSVSHIIEASGCSKRLRPRLRPPAWYLTLREVAC